MFSRLLVPLNGTAEAEVALPPALAIARAVGASIALVRVIRRDDPKEIEAATNNLIAVEREMEAAGVQTTTTVRVGAPAEEIVAEVELVGADLVVMATHGRSGLGRAVLGSVADGVVTHSPVPALLLRPGGHRVNRIGKILVPLDGTPGGAVAAGVALRLARATGARIRLVEAAVPLVAYSYGATYAGGNSLPDPSWDAEVRSAAEQYVGGMAARLRNAGVDADGQVVDAAIGFPPATIAAAIDAAATDLDADLIVMSSHTLTGPARTVLGSVADAVVRESHRPVLVIRKDTRLPLQAAGVQDSLSAASRPSSEAGQKPA